MSALTQAHFSNNGSEYSGDYGQITTEAQGVSSPRIQILLDQVWFIGFRTILIIQLLFWLNFWLKNFQKQKLISVLQSKNQELSVMGLSLMRLPSLFPSQTKKSCLLGINCSSPHKYNQASTILKMLKSLYYLPQLRVRFMMVVRRLGNLWQGCLTLVEHSKGLAWSALGVKILGVSWLHTSKWH